MKSAPNILLIIKMSSPTGRYAILFEEGPGYVLSEPLSHGAHGQVYLVISLEDGKSYIRKKLEAGDSFRELPFYHQLPTSMVPELIARAQFRGTKGDAAIFRY